MVALIVCALCSFSALAAALILQFRLPGWELLAGVLRLDLDHRARIDVRALSRLLSLVFWFVSFAFAASAVVLYTKAAFWDEILPFQFLSLLLAFNGFWFVYRRCDHNEYSEALRKLGRGLWAAINLLFLFPLVLVLF
ncbi:MAG TPA: hypothetical protein PL077_06560 [Treponemataceae bacterium]|nr:hypothetical protein [Treponemataceae bacterium]